MKTKQKKLSKKAIALLRKVQKTITEEPLRLNMGTWARQDAEENIVILGDEISPQDISEVEVKLPACGTVGCIAGWTAIHGLKNLPTIIINGHKMVDVGEIENPHGQAKDLLGITEAQAYQLFYMPTWDIIADSDGERQGWPKQFASAYAKAKSRKKKAEIACARIDHFIEHGV